MSQQRVQPEVLAILKQLRSSIQRYVFLEGSASVLALLGLIFWISLGLDWFYFLIQRAELPKAVRFVMLIAAASVVVGAILLWIVVRCFRQIHEKALALVLEKRFPELNDRLITSVELSEIRNDEPMLTNLMIGQTVEEVSRVARGLRLGNVFDARPLMRSSIAALCLGVSIAAFAVYFGDVFDLWYKRNVLLADDGWVRETEMSVVVLAEPGERVIQFTGGTPFDGGVYKHPRGSDLTIQADVLPDRKVPEQVQFRYWHTTRSGGGRSYFTRLGDSQFKHTLNGLLDDIDFTLYAGDAARIPFHVHVVDPPRIDSLMLEARYPEYTGWNTFDPDAKGGRDGFMQVPVQGTQISLPAGTDFHLNAATNKPLVGVKLQTEAYDIELTRTLQPESGDWAITASLTLFRQEAEDGPQGGTYPLPLESLGIAEDGMSFSLPFRLGSAESVGVRVEGANVVLPLPLPPDAVCRIFLSDVDQIQTAEPARLTINSIPDEAPRIETRLRGIGSAITRKAVIPVVGTIADDYGVELARFDYKVNDDEEFHERPFRTQPNRTTLYELQMSATEPYEKFEVLPLELSIGSKLVLSVFAADADDLHGPHTTLGERYTFQVVSEEELLSLLYARELNLRHRFEQILTEVQATHDDLVQQRNLLEELETNPAKPDDDAATAAARSSLQTAAISADRGLSGIRKNHNETRAIEQSFADIREETINNAVDTPQSLTRIDEMLLGPLHVINETDYNDVDQALALYRLALEDRTNPLVRADETLGHVKRLIEHMEAVLFEMRRLETFKEVVELLKAIKADQEELRKRTEAERKRKLIEALE